MKICQIVPSLEQRHGGPSRSVFALSQALAAAGHVVDLFATDPVQTGVEQQGRLHVTRFAREWPQRLSVSAGLRRALQHSEAGVFHHHGLWLRTLHYAHQRARRDGVLVLSPRGMMSTWAWEHHRWRKQLARHLIHPRALEAVDGWHATSVAEEAEIRARGFRQPVCVAPNGITLPGESARREAAVHWRQICPALAGRRVALFYSRFHRKKRVIELISAWLRHAPGDWLLLLVGIPQEYTAAELEQHVQQNSGAGRVAVFSGENHPPPYAVASLFLLPSHNENFGLVIAEAMAHAVPAVVTDTTPWQALNREACGWCVPWEQYGPALAAATAAGDEDRRTRGQRARAWILREFSWDRTAAHLAEFYHRLRTSPRQADRAPFPLASE